MAKIFILKADDKIKIEKLNYDKLDKNMKLEFSSNSEYLENSKEKFSTELFACFILDDNKLYIGVSEENKFKLYDSKMLFDITFKNESLNHFYFQMQELRAYFLNQLKDGEMPDLNIYDNLIGDSKKLVKLQYSQTAVTEMCVEISDKH